MQEPPPTNPAPLMGRFVVKVAGTTYTGLAAHEVAELLAGESGVPVEVFRIHRVDEVGRMELAGVAPAAFEQRDGMFFWRRRVDEARGDYDALIDFAGHMPPPCRIEMCLARVTEPAMPHVVVLVFPQACCESVGAWLGGCPSRLGDEVNGSPAALADYEGAVTDVVLRRTLEPAAVAGSSNEDGRNHRR